MKTIIHCFLFMLIPLGCFASGTPGGKSLSGKVIDKETKEPVVGAVIYFPDLKTGTISHADGSYFIDNLPASKVLIKVSLVGFEAVTEIVDLSAITTKDFELEESITEMNEVVVTGVSHSTEQEKMPTPVQVISNEKLLENAGANIIEALTKAPGISDLSSGPGISKPNIRGLGYNRVVVVNDGIRQEGQQWGDEHGTEIDEYSVNKVEILKGPASLIYGSDALAGVINMISSPTLPIGTINGNLLGNYQSNNGMFSYSGNLAGNMKGFIWDARFSKKSAHAYKNNDDGYVPGSKFNETNVNGILGINRSWGYSHLHLGSYHMQTEIVEGERDSATGKLIIPYALNDSTVIDTTASVSDLTGYNLGIPRQNILHYKAVLNNSFVIKNSILKLILGWQQNHRQEFADVLSPDEYKLYFLLNTLHYDIRFIFAEKHGLGMSMGVNGMQQRSQNKGEEFLVPEYGLFDLGTFYTVRKSWNKLDLSGGLRYDIRTLNAEELLLDTLGKPTTEADPFHVRKFEHFNKLYSNVSGSVGMTYAFSKKVYTKLNISRGFRSPNIAETGANGEHEGTGRYEIGNSGLKPETSLQFDFAFGINSKHLTAEMALFHNTISNYIYTEKLLNVSGNDSIMDPANPIPTFRFVQGVANLVGGEMIIDIHPHPLDWLHVENSFGYVLATQKDVPDSMKYLPFIPAPKLTSELRAEFKKAGKCIKNLYIKAEMVNYFAQDHFYAAFGTETATPAYTLFNIGLGGMVVAKERNLFSLFFSINNLTDEVYQSHMSRLKYCAENFVTGKRGVFGMGRNISIKLLVPLELRKQKRSK